MIRDFSFFILNAFFNNVKYENNQFYVYDDVLSSFKCLENFWTPCSQGKINFFRSKMLF